MVLQKKFKTKKIKLHKMQKLTEVRAKLMKSQIKILKYKIKILKKIKRITLPNNMKKNITKKKCKINKIDQILKKNKKFCRNV